MLPSVDIFFDPDRGEEKEVVATLFGPYNVIEHKNFEKLGIQSEEKKVGIWPENVLISEDVESDNQLISSTFMGHYWKNVISSQGQEIVQYGVKSYSSGNVTINSYFTIE